MLLDRLLSGESISDKESVAALPMIVPEDQVAKEVAKGVEKAYKHYGDKSKYTLGFIRNLRNPKKALTVEERLQVPKEISEIQIVKGLPHDYKFFKNKQGKTILQVSPDVTDPLYVGEKAATKQFYLEGIGSTSRDASKPFTRAQQDLLQPRRVRSKTIEADPNNTIPRLMREKVELGIKSSFDEITPEEAKKLFESGYLSNIFKRNGSSEQT